MAELLFSDRSLLPLIHLESWREDEIFDVSDFRRKRNLVIYLLTRPDEDLFLRIEESLPLLRQENAEVVVMVRSDAEILRDLCRKHRITFWLLPDPEGNVWSRFVKCSAQEQVAALYISDKFGDIFFRYLSGEPKDLPDMTDIFKSLQFIESQCPECSGGI